MALTPLVANLLLFGRVLRHAGLDVHHSRLVDTVRALDWVGVRSRDDVRAALATLLVHRREDLARFDQAFDLFFRARGEPASHLALFSLGERPKVVARPRVAGPVRLDAEGGPSDGSREAGRGVGAWSAVTVSRTRDFADFTRAELDEACRLLARLPWHLGVRRTRRWTPGASAAIDVRRSLRRNLMRGDLIELGRRRRRDAVRPIVVIGDVSGSMERYSRMLLHFIHGLARSARHVESFVFATSLTRLTRAIARRGAASELARVARDVTDWGGGTRIGEALHAFNTRWARRVLRHGPVVIIVSDGWDRGDPAVIPRELARLARSCRRLIWLNPLLGSAGYEPLTRGLQAALPFIDDFLPAHNLASLESLAAHLAALPPHRPTRRAGPVPP